MAKVSKTPELWPIIIKIAQASTDIVQWKPFSPVYNFGEAEVRMEVPAGKFYNYTGPRKYILEPEGLSYVLNELARITSNAEELE